MWPEALIQARVLDTTRLRMTQYGRGGASLAIAEAKIGVAWIGTRVLNNNLDVTTRFSVSFDHGQTFSPGVRIDDDSDLSISTAPNDPSLVFRKGTFYVAWMQKDTPSGPQRIFFSCSSDTGQTFVPSVDVNANTTAPNNFHRKQPGLTVNEEGTAFVAWLDGRYITEIGNTWLVFGSFGRFSHLYKGDLNLDDMLTAADVVLELNKVFLNEPYPAPERLGDLNCDTSFSPADVVLILNRVFLGTLIPC